jgi:hypothetical protein
MLAALLARSLAAASCRASSAFSRASWSARHLLRLTRSRPLGPSMLRRVAGSDLVRGCQRGQLAPAPLLGPVDVAHDLVLGPAVLDPPFHPERLHGLGVLGLQGAQGLRAEHVLGRQAAVGREGHDHGVKMRG